ncbi:MAG: S8 family serine peptidase [Saprospiraceae bacterium]
MKRLSKVIRILIIIILFSNNIFSQSIISNEILLETTNNISDSELINEIKSNLGIPDNVEIQTISTSPLKIKKIIIDSDKNSSKIINYLSKSRNIKNVQFNHKIQLRATPNDSLYTDQWYLNNTGQSGGQVDADIDADLAWDLMNSNVTPLGDTIVICVVDDGCDISHEDLQGNIWTNYNEIPDNGIDDDGNNYVDDYHGYNPVSENGDIPSGTHGTAVCGLIGAKANNEIGIAGINWNIKVMPVYNGDTYADILAAYSYAYSMRKLYNETNGAKGAFIVATNSSFGIDYAKPSEYPLWCSMYDSLGSVGIINIVATTNLNLDVDAYGDVPSACPSDYMVAVTNMNMYNSKVSSAGYGAENVDVGSYGENVITIRPSNQYTSFSGTSAATPVATGIVGLIYSYGEKLNEIAKSSPPSAALLVKQSILDGVKSNNNLKNKTVAEGVVNAYNSMKAIKIYDSECSPPAIYYIDSITMNSAIVSWDNEEGKLYNIELLNNETDEINVYENITSPLSLTELEPCSEYKLRIQQNCTDSLSEFSYYKSFKTDGCCISPEITDYTFEGDSLYITWNNITVADEYTLISKSWADPIWDTLTTNKNNAKIYFPFDCGEVLTNLSSNCNSIPSETSNSIEINKYCTDCLSHVYCYPSIDNSYEWITKVQIGNFINESTIEDDGTGAFINAPSFKLISNAEYKAKIDIDFSNIIYSDSLYIWIDLNGNNKFTENEIVARGANNGTKEVTCNIAIPKIDFSGITTMRVLLSAYQITDPCDIENNDYGEYEDYCIEIDSVTTCTNDDLNLKTDSISTDLAMISWNNNGAYKYLFSLEDEDGNELEFDFKNIESITFTGLDTCAYYRFGISQYCNSYDYSPMEYFDFKTLCSNAVEENENISFNIFPNPTSNLINIENKSPKFRF